MVEPLRLLIVDDDLEQAKQIASSMEQSPALADCTVDIQLTNNAYFVAKNLKTATSANDVAWDIVIADVYMPRFVKECAPGAELDDSPEPVEEKGRTIWRSEHCEAASESPMHGGFHIAETIRDLKASVEWWKEHLRWSPKAGPGTKIDFLGVCG